MSTPPDARSERPERRKNGSLRLPIQKAIAVRMTVQWLSAAIVAVVFTLLLQFLANPTAPPAEAARIRSLTWGPMLLAFLATAPMAALDIARFSHSIAGPIVRLKRLVGELADGRSVPRVTFRKDDHWHDLAAEFNRLTAEVERLREVESARSDQQELVEA